MVQWSNPKRIFFFEILGSYQQLRCFEFAALTIVRIVHFHQLPDQSLEGSCTPPGASAGGLSGGALGKFAGAFNPVQPDHVELVGASGRWVGLAHGDWERVSVCLICFCFVFLLFFFALKY
jgi:hypothetical protein